MKFSKILLLMIALLPFYVAMADHSAEPCAPEREPQRSLHIAWISCDDNDDEILVIINGTNADMDLTGYEIIERDGASFTFSSKGPNFLCCTIGANDIVRIHTGPGNNRPFGDARDLHWLKSNDNLPFEDTIWNDSGDVAKLIDPQGNVVDEYQYGN